MFCVYISVGMDTIWWLPLSTERQYSPIKPIRNEWATDVAKCGRYIVLAVNHMTLVIHV